MTPDEPDETPAPAASNAPAAEPQPESKQTVKELLSGAQLDQAIDAATQAELMRWFSLPSFGDAPTKGEPPPDDPELAEVRERRQKAIALVDRAILERIERRYEVDAYALLLFQPNIELKLKLDHVSMFDPTMANQAWRLVDVRERDYSEELLDEMKEVTPQALLRDLHRPEDTFGKEFELTDFGAAQKIDIVAEIAAALRADLRLPPLGVSPFEEQRRLLRTDAANRRRSLLDIPMPNRQVTE